MGAPGIQSLFPIHDGKTMSPWYHHLLGGVSCSGATWTEFAATLATRTAARVDVLPRKSVGVHGVEHVLRAWPSPKEEEEDQ